MDVRPSAGRIAWTLGLVGTVLVSVDAGASARVGVGSAADGGARIEVADTDRDRARALQAYVDLQRALAGDDAARAEHAIRDLARRKAVPKLTRIAAGVIGVRDLGRLRVAFRDLTAVVIAHLREHPNPLDRALDLAECSMAFDGKGAQWLQVDQKIANPYYGASMLQCGAFKGSAKPGRTLQE